MLPAMLSTYTLPFLLFQPLLARLVRIEADTGLTFGVDFVICSPLSLQAQFEEPLVLFVKLRDMSANEVHASLRMAMLRLHLGSVISLKR